ncbi:tumor protein D53 homolog isoform X1 [Petromyzon marinus]|uniref:Tumor protein D53 homolog isoform X1 n=1 Tax=Petromyzon marinus TaxID=7757 RepID=A0AAJ7TIV1_PETMA|nr:tumor protein D53 homolog isoform X1 [Petromyzon marinus]
MEAVQQGLLDPDTMQEVAVDPVPAQDGACSVSSAEREELEAELAKVEEEISTLRQVLTAKERHAAEIKRKLGLSPLNELRTNLSRGWQDMQATNAYKKTQETLTVAGQKTTSVLSNVGSAITRKLGDMNDLYLRLLVPRSHSFSYSSIRHSISMPAMRNSPSFKSFEERVENTVTTLKSKVGGEGQASSNFEEVLSSTASASGHDASNRD